MKTYVALLRGINVGGNTSLSMKDLTGLFFQLGFDKVETYIRSGNIVFSSQKESATEVCEMISELICTRFSFMPKVLVLLPEDIHMALEANPFPDSEPKSVHFGFLWQDATEPDLGRMEELKKETEQMLLTDKVFYLFAPEGIGRSKLASNAERLIGVTKTDRNLRTVKAIEGILERSHG